MCRSQCLLTILTLAINYANSWDIAISEGDTIQFYTNHKHNFTKAEERSRDLTALAYDAVHNMLLFVDKQDDNASIFSYHLATEISLPLVGKKSYMQDIQGIAFDPITSKLFWTDKNDRSIYWKSLKAGDKSEVYGNLLLKLDGEIPRAIAVDSCRGYVYWSNINIKKPTIERAKFDGSEWHTVIETDIYMPTSLAIDQRTKKLYWTDDKEGIHFSIESADIDDPTKRTTLLKGIHHQPFAMSLTKDDIYWVDWGYQSVWRLPKNSTGNVEPEQLFMFNSTAFGIVGNYSIDDQTENATECANLVSFARNKTVINNDFNIPTDAGVHCLHGVRMEAKIGGLPSCKCSLGYEGERCEINVCQNYCVHGSCSVTADGTPTCSCKSGYTGDRCEVNMCSGFCLNHGECSVEGGRPMCACSGHFEGLRCETAKTDRLREMEKESCNCTTSQAIHEGSDDGEFVTMTSCVDGWDPIRDPILMVLGTLCGLLSVACMVLITKVLQLKKRPRIRKRIIVNKNVTPLTARPDQCEITIENCCNMNICETPCFEPRSTIRPSLLDSKPGKEEKKNLIANMELPDDY